MLINSNVRIFWQENLIQGFEWRWSLSNLLQNLSINCIFIIFTSQTYPGSFTQSKNWNMQLCVNSINRFLYKKSSKPLELMHTDVCGPAPIQLSIVLNTILYLLMISPNLLGFSCWNWNMISNLLPNILQAPLKIFLIT